MKIYYYILVINDYNFLANVKFYLIYAMEEFGRFLLRELNSN